MQYKNAVAIFYTQCFMGFVVGVVGGNEINAKKYRKWPISGVISRIFITKGYITLIRERNENSP